MGKFLVVGTNTETQDEMVVATFETEGEARKYVDSLSDGGEIGSWRVCEERGDDYFEGCEL